MIDPLPGDIFRKGQVLNNTYEIEGVLGRGGTGEVYRARNQITGRVVAVKALNREFSHNDAYLELMKREEEMRSIHHDAVVRYTDCSRTAEGHVYLVMDYVDGTPLADWLDRRRRRRATPDRRAPGGGGAGGDPRAADRPPRPLARQHHPARRRPGRRR